MENRSATADLNYYVPNGEWKLLGAPPLIRIERCGEGSSCCNFAIFLFCPQVLQATERHLCRADGAAQDQEEDPLLHVSRSKKTLWEKFHFLAMLDLFQVQHRVPVHDDVDADGAGVLPPSGLWREDRAGRHRPTRLLSLHAGHCRKDA